MSYPITFDLMGEEWSIHFASRPFKEDIGSCNRVRREITLCPSIRNQPVLREVIIHEVLHALQWWLDEDAVYWSGVGIDEALEACHEILD